PINARPGRASGAADPTADEATSPEAGATGPEAGPAGSEARAAGSEARARPRTALRVATGAVLAVVAAVSADGVARDAANGQEFHRGEIGCEQKKRRLHELSPWHISAGRSHGNKTPERTRVHSPVPWGDSNRFSVPRRL